MRAAIVNAANSVAVEDVAEPEASGDALVKIHRVGLCGTDVKIASGAIPIQYPTIMGHEMVGTVVRPGHRGLLAEGDRVLVDPAISCGYCDQCLKDSTHLCRNGGLMGRDVPGGFAEYASVDEVRLHRIPDHVPDDEAVVMQVLGTCLHGQTMVDVFPGETAVVLGLGVSGLMHMQLLKARGIERVIGITRSAWKREMATELGAFAVAPPEEAVDLVREITNGLGPELVVESAGVAASLAQSIELASLGGTILGFGTLTATQAELPFYLLYLKELNFVQSRAARPRDYARSIDLVASGAVRVKPLLTHQYDLSEVNTALQAFDEPTALKISLEVG